MPDNSDHELPLPWGPFLDELDEAISSDLALLHRWFHGQLVVRLPRPTGDVEYIAVNPRYRMDELEQLAGSGSNLESKYKIHLQHVAVATMPEDYESQLKEMFPGRFKKLKIFAPDPYDLALSRLDRNNPKDQGDVEFLAKAKTVPLDPKQPQDRYDRELRPNLMARQSWYDGTLKMWIASYF